MNKMTVWSKDCTVICFYMSYYGGREINSLCRFSILHRFYTDMITDFTPLL